MTNVIILGGTGTLGTALARELLINPSTHITVLSRGEHKQKQMAADFNYDPRISFVIGDIRDRDALLSNLAGFDLCFHVAALKHVDTGEYNPEEFVKTDTIGTINVADAAVFNRIPHVVFSSTDKAVDPANLYGCCKLISEKILFARNKRQKHTRFSVFRWGNVASSQGSVIPLFIKSIKERGEYSITHPDMTRFWIKIDEAVRFMISNYKSAPTDRVMIPPIKSAKVSVVAEAIADLLGIQKPECKITGVRPGEKIHELLSSIHTDLPPISSEACTFGKDELMEFLDPIVWDQG